MKKLISTFVLVSICAWASSIPMGQIKLANKYLSQFLEEGLFSLEITSGNINEANLIDDLAIKSEILDMLTVNLTTYVSGSDVAFKASVESIEDGEDYDELAQEIIEMLPDLITQYPDFNILYTVDRSDFSTKVKATITAKDLSSMLNFIKISATVTKAGAIHASLDASVKSQSAIVLKAQYALTDMFNSFVNQEDPAEEDMDTLFEIYETVLNEL